MELQEEGFRFHPTDSELLKFLLRFICKQPLCDDGFIAELDIYKQEPWVTYGLGCHCGGDDDGDTSIFRYFITPRHKKKKENNKFRRVVGVGEDVGTWKGLDKGKQVISNSLIIGLKRSLSYGVNKKNSSCSPHDHGKWLMKEYELSESILKRFTNSDLRDYVICAIKSKPDKNSSNAIPTPINMVENNMVENNVAVQLPQYQPSHEDCSFGVNEYPMADWQYQPLHESYSFGVNEDPLADWCTFGVNEDPMADWQVRANELYTDFAGLIY